MLLTSTSTSHGGPSVTGRVQYTSLHSNTHSRALPSRNPFVHKSRLPQKLIAKASAESVQTGSQVAGTVSGDRGLNYTTHEGNSWMANFKASGVNVLVDPWLVGNLVFADSDWLYKGVKRVFKPGKGVAEQIASTTDVILLTMSLPDHTHLPTLEALPKTLPVLASPSAAAVAKGLGFKTVYMLDHGETVTVCDGRLSIQATAGALVGPPWSKRENGYVMTENVPNGIKLYYEPHCDYDEASLQSVGSVDVVVSPPSNQELAGLYPLADVVAKLGGEWVQVKGYTDNERLVSLLKPKTVIALCNAEFDASGPLDAMIVEKGGVAELQRQLQPYNVTVLAPAPAGTPMTVLI